MSERQDPRIAEARRLLGDAAVVDAPLGSRTTYRIGGTASLLVEARTLSDLSRIASVTSSTGVPVLVVGRGSNLLVSDRGFEGLCIALATGLDTVSIAPDRLEVTALSGVSYPVLARKLSSVGLVGMEWAVGVPGSVGGAVAMNAGGHGSETRERLVDATVIDLLTGKEEVLTNDDLDLSYRHSAIGATDLVVAARFRLDEGDPVGSGLLIDEIVSWRRENQPGGRNAGSVFTNPVGDSAGRLIDQAGLKGLRVGCAQVSTRHANFIQADPGGSAEDVLRLIELVRSLVAERTGAVLSTEIRLIGFKESDRSLVRGDVQQ